MSVCIFIASEEPLKEFGPSKKYHLHINLDTGTVYDGGADDNYYLHFFSELKNYTDKDYAVSLEWRYTEGRARHLIEYIKSALCKTEAIEFWKVWLADYYEFEDRPYVHRKTISIEAL